MNFRIVKFFLIIGILIVYSQYFVSNAEEKIIVKITDNLNTEIVPESIGIGGGGALFSPAISPFNSNDLMVRADMGGIYISHDAGISWNRKNLHGTAMCTYYDPNREGVLYAGGSGLYRSTDNGDNFELLFPNKDDVIKRINLNENGMHYIYTKSKVYPTNKYIIDVMVNPNDSNNIFVISYYNKNGIVFESKDNGETFESLFEYTKSTAGNIHYGDFNKLFYKKETNELYMINSDGVFKYNQSSKSLDTVYSSEKGIVRATSVFDTETKFIVIENQDLRYNATTKVYYTSDFLNITDLTENITKNLDNTYDDSYGHSIFYYAFTFIEAKSINHIYLAHASKSTNTSYPYDFSGIVTYIDGESKFLYGIPYRNHNTLDSRLWADGNIRPYGLAISRSDDAYMFTTLVGVNYSPDGKQLHPRYSTKIDNTTFTTSGIDEQTTYGVRIDPFDKNNLLLLNTDLGLIKSSDNGKTWNRANSGIPSKWVNTIYDACYDKDKEGIVYSVWSGRHDAPYTAKNETDNIYGGFAYSSDGGATWNSTYSSGLPENIIPVKLKVKYNENSDERTIYIASFNEGFFVSYDSGKTFTQMNDGLERVNYNDTYSYILASDIEITDDGRIFGQISRSTYNNKTQDGYIAEFINGKWYKLEINENCVNPRDIYYHDGTLYISSTAKAIWNYKDGSDFNNYGGGIYTYKNGIVHQIFDESISVTGVQFDSKETMYISDINGNIYRKEKNKGYERIYKEFHSISKWVELYDDDTIYLANFGGGVLRLSNLESLYPKEEITENNKLGDIDLDGKISINDLAQLKLHLIDKEIITEEKRLNLADIDKDGKISINDLANLKLMLIENED